MMGAHLLRAGTSRILIDLMRRGFIDHIAMNGAGAIHASEERKTDYARKSGRRSR